VVDIGEQREPEVLRVGERLVLGRRVEAGAEDLGAYLGELGASVTEALSFPRSASGRRLRVPPQHDPGPP
jgi:hypothetical protein